MHTNRYRAAKQRRESGFTVLELMVSMALLVVIAGAAVAAMNYFQNSARSTSVQQRMHQEVRAALEQISQDVSRAGVVNSGLSFNGPMPVPTGTSSNIAGTMYYLNAISGTTVSLSGNNGYAAPTFPAYFFYNESLAMVTSGGNSVPGLFSISAVNTISNTITLSEAPGSSYPVGSAVYTWGIFNEGIVPPDTLTGSGTSLGDSSATQLVMFGDMEGDGTIKLIEYVCPAAGQSGQPLMRYEWNMVSTAPNSSYSSPISSVALVENVNNTDGNGCVFSYDVRTGTSTTVPSAYQPVSNTTTLVSVDHRLDTGCACSPHGPRFVVGVGISIRVTSTEIDPQTGRHYEMFKSMLNVQPRNIVAAYQRVLNYNSTYESALLKATDFLQPTPQNASLLYSSVN